MVSTRKIDTTKLQDLKTFIDFPFQLYKDSPYWVPSLRSEIEGVLDKKSHPFYDHSQADFFIAEQDDKTLGRITGIYNQKFNEFSDINTAFFYYFDSVNDPDVAQSLFQKACEWAKEKGAEKIYGPKGLLQGDGIGLLVKGFDYPPAMGILYNYPYYHDLLIQQDFEKVSDYYSGYLSSSIQLPDKVNRIADLVKKRKGYWVKKFKNKRELLDVAPQIRDVYNMSFSGGEGFRPITADEMEVIAQQILTIADPRLIKLVYKDDMIVGFLFAYPNIWQGLRKSRGKLWPFGWFHIWRDMRTTDYVDVNGMGILPQHQGLGAAAVLYVELEKTIREFGFKHVETVQVREDNTESMGENKMLNVEWYKTHRVYQKYL